MQNKLSKLVKKILNKAHYDLSAGYFIVKNPTKG